MQDSQIDLEAAEWLVRLDDVERHTDAKEQQDWMAWLQRSPRHVQAYFDVARIAQSVDEVPPEGRQRIREMLAAHRSDRASLAGLRFLKEDRGVRFPHPKWLAATAAIVGVMITATLWWSASRDSYEAGVGEQVAYTLPDGSSMLLNTRSRASVVMNEHERAVELEGEALFTVAREAARPFLVRTDSALTRALGTQFNVYAQAHGATRVSVVEGAVQVAAVRDAAQAASPSSKPADALVLSAGQEAEVSHSRVVKRPAANVAAAIAWREKVLVFEDATLQEVAAQFNRYNALQFSMAPKIGATHRLSGTFDPRHPEYFQAYLERNEALRVTVEGDVVRVRGVSSQE